MTRTLIAIAVALVALPALLASSAEACISCNYVPEVARTPAPPPSAYRSYSKKKPHIDRWLSKGAPAQKRSVAKSQPPKSKPSPRKVDTAKAPATEQKSASDPRGSGTDDASEAASSGSTSSDTADDVAEKPKVAERSGCVKFFPSIGKTLAVPCE